MIILNNSQVKELIGRDGYGCCHFMGGVNCDAYHQIYLVKDKGYLFTQDEIACHTLEYEKIVQMQIEEGKEFLEAYENRV